MDTYIKVQNKVAEQYKRDTTKGKKSIADFFMDDNATHAVNVKSNNRNKSNYSPNMISIKRMHKWVYEEKKNLSFVFVDYEENEQGEPVYKNDETFELIALEHIKWDCLSIEAQGYGVIQMKLPLQYDKSQTKRTFYEGF